MSESSKIDWDGLYRELVRVAQSRTGAPADPGLRGSMGLESESWECAADERCFCGRTAIGFKFYERSEKMPYCGDHLTEAITRDVLFRMNVRRLN